MAEALSKLKVAELKEKLQEAGLPVSGKKDELVERLLAHQQQNAEPAKKEEAAVAGEPTSTSASASTSAPAPAEAATQKPATETNTKQKVEATTSAPSSSAPSSSAPSNETLAAELEKRKARAARFGVELSDADKALERALKFGTVEQGVAAAVGKVDKELNGKKSTNANAGASANGSTQGQKRKLTQEQQEQLNKRAQRFGVPTKTSTAPTLSAEEQEKAKKRAERFGLNK